MFRKNIILSMFLCLCSLHADQADLPSQKARLLLQMTPRGIEKKLLFFVYYNGRSYPVSMDSVMGGAICIDTLRIPPTLLVCITQNPQRRIRSEQIVGMEVCDTSSCAYYLLTYIVNEDGISYRWKVEKLDFCPTKIPDDALVIAAHPDAVSIELVTTAHRCGSNMAILPLFVMRDHVSHDDAALAALDLGQIHESVFSL